ncbi:SDR family oxidoreductase [Pseudomonas sp.]|jgi:UDP-glucose 4-epimerase|uniref:UDP-glucose 4-epimerase family protein n=1 Tax=Pseudomonas sp. TaxID=306 RepID=UPI00258DF59C|nr:SDR family oxidoreductase [Pseudomonas sp.]
MKVLLTGASGFVGGGLLEKLSHRQDVDLLLPVRRELPNLPGRSKSVVIEGFNSKNNWSELLHSVDLIIHCASRVHVMAETSENPLAEYRETNVEGTLNLARQAIAAGCRRFVFISSIKVNGERTLKGVPFSAADVPAPTDPYGVSKMEAEDGLRALVLGSSMEVVIVRPVLVYGPGVKANFLNMMRWLKKGIPLPFGAINNKRSLVALDNLVDFIIVCSEHPNAANQTFLISDDEDLSTTQLLRRMAIALGRRALLLPVPASLLILGARLLGRESLSQRLCGSLQVDIEKSKTLLDWRPSVSVDDALRKTALSFDEGHYHD